MAYSDNFPKRLLDSLTERVCRPIQKLSTRITTGTPLWNGPIEMCEQLEKDPLSVDSVIVSARTLNGNFSGVNILFYHAVLCRVYILLRYRHGEDEVYKTVVYPRLLENMGVYGKPEYLKSINEQVDRVKELEALVAKAGKTEVKPVFKFVRHSRPEMDNLYIEYSDEKLFRVMTNEIKRLSQCYRTYLDETEVWHNAKLVVKTLREIKRPELFIERAATSLVNGRAHEEYDGAQQILIAVYAMVRASRHDEHFDAFISKMESLGYAPTELFVIEQEIGVTKKLVDDNLPFDDYDYVGDRQVERPSYSREDMEKAFADYRQQLAEMEKQLQSAREQLQRYESEETAEEIAWHDKVRLELLLRMMETDGVDMKQVVKARVAELMQSITGLASQTCKNYCTNRDLNTKKHEEEVLKLNTKLQALGMKIRI